MGLINFLDLEKTAYYQLISVIPFIEDKTRLYFSHPPLQLGYGHVANFSPVKDLQN